MNRFYLTLMALSFASCNSGLDSYEELIDLRVLGLQAEPPELLIDLPEAQNAAVSFKALVVDPRHGPVTYHWSFCPIASSTACLDYNDVRALATASDAAMLDGLRNATQGGTTEPVNAHSMYSPLDWWGTRAAWPYDLPAFPVTLPGTLAYYHVQDSGMGFGMGVWPSAVLDVQTGDESVKAIKRVTYGIANRRELAQLASELGGEAAAAMPFELCYPEQTPATQPGCLPLKDATPNHNPMFARVRAAQGKDPTNPDWTDIELNPAGDVAGVVTVVAGEWIRLLPEFTPESSEPYQNLKADLVDGSLHVEDLVEDIAVTWFVTSGKLLNTLTWPLFTKSLDTAYQAPDVPPADTNGRLMPVGGKATRSTAMCMAICRAITAPSEPPASTPSVYGVASALRSSA